MRCIRQIPGSTLLSATWVSMHHRKSETNRNGLRPREQRVLLSQRPGGALFRCPICLGCVCSGGRWGCSTVHRGRRGCKRASWRLRAGSGAICRRRGYWLSRWSNRRIRWVCNRRRVQQAGRRRREHMAKLHRHCTGAASMPRSMPIEARGSRNLSNHKRAEPVCE